MARTGTLGVLLTVLTVAFSLAGAPAALAASGTLVYSWPSNVGPLNPHLYSPNQMFAQAMVYEPLVRYGEGGRIIPWLAQSWEISPDGTEYVFTLRRGVVFSDGAPFNAEAAKKNFDAIQANAKRHEWLDIARQIKDTAVVDEYRLRLTLRAPYYPTLQDLCLIRPYRFLSPAAFAEDGTTAPAIKAPVGTGPWVLTETKLGEYDVFTRNEKYWGRKPALEKVVVKVIQDPNTRAIAFETGDLDFIYGNTGQIPLDTYRRFRDSGKYKTLMSAPLGTRAIALNSFRGPTRDLAVRKAVLHAVDKGALLDGVFFGTERRAETFFSPDFPYCNVGLSPYAHDPEAAGKLLDGAGWVRSPGKPFRTKDGKELALDLCFTGNNALAKSLAEVIQGDLRKVGIRVNLLGEEDDSFYKRQREGEFDLIFSSTSGLPYDPHSHVSSMRAPSHADYQAQRGLPMKAALDADITAVLLSTDEAARRDLYRKILATLHEQAVYLPLSYMTNIALYREGLKGARCGFTTYEIPFEDMGKE